MNESNRSRMTHHYFSYKLWLRGRLLNNDSKFEYGSLLNHLYHSAWMVKYCILKFIAHIQLHVYGFLA